MNYWLEIFFLSYFVALNSMYSLLTILSYVEIIQRRATRLPELDKVMLSGRNMPPITIIVPAHNEERVIVDSVTAFTKLDYPNLHIIVVNDGSTDGTFERLKAAFFLKPINLVVRRELLTKPVRAIYQSVWEPRLTVVDKENGGKSDALNAGLNVCRTPLVCNVDADTIIERRALLRMVEPFLYDDRQVIAVGGTVRLSNSCVITNGIDIKVKLSKSWLVRFQVLEFLRAFLFGRMGYNRLGGNLIISGAFGLYVRDILVRIGGYEHNTVGEDMELVVRIHRYLRDNKKPYKILYIPDPVAYTEAPEQLKVLRAQRDRWQRGLIESLWRHRYMFFNPSYGAIGFIVFPLHVIFELLGPVVELVGYSWFLVMIILGRVDVNFAVLFVMVAVFWGFLFSVNGLVLDDLISQHYRGFTIHARLYLVAFLENFGYRQMTLWFRLWGTIRYILGARSWGKMIRTGYRKRDSVQTA